MAKNGLISNCGGTTYNAGSTGGEATHQLTVGELPSHNHTASTNTTGNHTHTHPGWQMGEGIRHQDGCSAIPQRGDQGGYSGTYTFSTAGNHSHTITINSTGNNQSHNNLQPYISIYIWKRVQ